MGVEVYIIFCGRARFKETDVASSPNEGSNARPEVAKLTRITWIGVAIR